MEESAIGGLAQAAEAAGASAAAAALVAGEGSEVEVEVAMAAVAAAATAAAAAAASVAAALRVAAMAQVVELAPQLEAVLPLRCLPMGPLLLWLQALSHVPALPNAGDRGPGPPLVEEGGIGLAALTGGGGAAAGAAGGVTGTAPSTASTHRHGDNVDVDAPGTLRRWGVNVCCIRRMRVSPHSLT